MPANIQKLPSPIFLLGAAYSGKSELAIRMMAPLPSVTVIGTAEPLPGLLGDRIKSLKSMRPPEWIHTEGVGSLAEVLAELIAKDQNVLIDSYNQWLANELLHKAAKYSEEQLHLHFGLELKKICEVLGQAKKQRIVILSNEVGSGVTPPQDLARTFRMLLGQAHVKLAEVAKAVVWVTAGLPQILKS